MNQYQLYCILTSSIMLYGQQAATLAIISLEHRDEVCMQVSPTLLYIVHRNAAFHGEGMPVDESKRMRWKW